MKAQLHYFRTAVVLAVALCLQLMAGPGFAQGYDVPTELKGLGFGLGISMSADVGRQSHVVQATNVNGIVRIKETQDVIVGFVLETHYFFAQGRFRSDPFGMNPLYDREWGTGPFVAIELGGANTTGNNNPVSAYALGWMVGFREAPKIDPTTKKPVFSNLSWNFGLGLRVDPGAKVLGDGIVANQPLPPGESVTEVRLKSSPRYGLMVISSFGF